jgi:hypothetical protein
MSKCIHRRAFFVDDKPWGRDGTSISLEADSDSNGQWSSLISLLRHRGCCGWLGWDEKTIDMQEHLSGRLRV